jgi:hypothetical protein
VTIRTVQVIAELFAYATLDCGMRIHEFPGQSICIDDGCAMPLKDAACF